MTTRALEDSEIKAIFEHVSGYNAKRNEMLLIIGIGMALRVSELVGLKVGDVYDGGQVKLHVTIRGETAKFNKNSLSESNNGINHTTKFWRCFCYRLVLLNAVVFRKPSELSPQKENRGAN